MGAKRSWEANSGGSVATQAALQLFLALTSRHPLDDEFVDGVGVAARARLGDGLVERADLVLEAVALAQEQALLEGGLGVFDLEVLVGEDPVVKHAVLAWVDELEQLALAGDRLTLERGLDDAGEDRVEALVGHAIEHPFSLGDAS